MAGPCRLSRGRLDVRRGGTGSGRPGRPGAEGDHRLRARPTSAPGCAQTRKRLADPDVRVLVVGEFKQGKSQLVNALVNAPVCPVDDDIATAVPTVVRHAETTTVALVRESARRARPSAPRCRSTSSPSTSREAGNPGNKADAHLRRGRPPAQAPRRRAGARRHPGRRRARLGARRGHDVGAAQRGRRAARLRRRAGVHRPGAGVPRRGDEAVPERRAACSPRPTSTRTGGGSWSWTAATCATPGSAPRSFPVSSTLRLHAAKTQDADADGRVRLPAAGRLPAAPGGGARPTSWTAAPPARTCWRSPSSWPPG